MEKCIKCEKKADVKENIGYLCASCALEMYKIREREYVNQNLRDWLDKRDLTYSA